MLVISFNLILKNIWAIENAINFNFNRGLMIFFSLSGYTLLQIQESN